MRLRPCPGDEEPRRACLALVRITGTASITESSEALEAGAKCAPLSPRARRDPVVGVSVSATSDAAGSAAYVAPANPELSGYGDTPCCTIWTCTAPRPASGPDASDAIRAGDMATLGGGCAAITAAGNVTLRITGVATGGKHGFIAGRRSSA